MSRKLGKHEKGLDHFLIQDGCFFPSQKIPKTNKLPPNIYTIKTTPQGAIYFRPMSAMTDGLVDLPKHVSGAVIKEVKDFWSDTTRAKFEKYEMVYKRGIILYGPPGTGKSVIVSKIMEAVVEEGGIVFFDPAPRLLYEAMNQVKEIQGDVKVLVVYEEFDSWLARSESDFLSLLDGELQIENIVYLATTNFLDRVPPRIRNRPSRIASVIEVKYPDVETRRAFLLGKVKDDPIDIELWIKLTEGMSLDHLKDLIISVLCIGVPLEDAIKKLREMNSRDLGPDDDEDDEKFDYDAVGNIVKSIERGVESGKRSFTIRLPGGFQNPDGN